MLQHGKDKSTKAQQNSLSRMFLGSGGRFIEREGVSTLSIHGYPWALRYLLIYVFKSVCFSIVSEFEKKFLWKFRNNSCISPQECLKNCFESFLKVSVWKEFWFVLNRASIYESSTHPKELVFVNVLKVVTSHHWEVGSTTVGGVRVNSFVGTVWSPEQ